MLCPNVLDIVGDCSYGVHLLSSVLIEGGNHTLFSFLVDLEEHLHQITVHTETGILRSEGETIMTPGLMT